MRPYLLAAALLAGLALLTPTTLEAQWVVGAQTGPGAFNVSGTSPEGVSYGRRTRLMASAVVGYRVSPSVVLRLEPGLVRRGASIAVDVGGVEEAVDSLSLDLDYVSIPLVVQVFTKGGRGFVSTGLDLGFLSSATVSPIDGGPGEDVQDTLDGTDVSWMFGVGGLVYRGTPEVSLEVRYSQSLVRVFDGRGAGDTGALPGGLRSSGFQLLAGVAWRLGGDR